MCWHKEEVVSKLVLREPQHGQTRRGIKTTYIHTLLEDAGFTTIGELNKTAVLDQSNWRGRIHVVRANARPN